MMSVCVCGRTGEGGREKTENNYRKGEDSEREEREGRIETIRERMKD